MSTRLTRRQALVASVVAAVAVGCGSRKPAGVVRADAATGLQPAIDQVRAQGGGTVEIPAGTEFVERSVTLPTSVNLDVRGALRRQPGTSEILLALTGDDCEVRGYPGGLLDGRRASTPAKADTIRITGNGNLLSGLTVRDSASNGIAVFSGARNRIDACTITDSRDNGVLITDRGADGNIVSRNRVVGTDEQNGIFLTASSGSTPTADAIRDNQVLGNDVSGVGDAGIESGIHTVDTVIADNTVRAGRNPGIILRDCTGVQVLRSTVVSSTDTLDALAVVPQTQPATVPVTSAFVDCSVQGGAERSGVYVGSAGVTLTRIRLLGSAAPAPPRGSAVVTSAVDDLEITEPLISSWQRAFFLNYATTPAVLRHVRVTSPHVDRVDYLYTALSAHLLDCTLDLGTVTALSTGLFQSNGLTTLDGSSSIAPVPAGLGPGVDLTLPPLYPGG